MLAHPQVDRTPRHAAPGMDEPCVVPRPDASPRVPRGVVLLLGSRPRPLRALRPLLLPGVRSLVEGSACVQGVRGSPVRSGEARLMRIAVCHPQAPFMAGAAEVHVRGLVAALREAGHEAETVTMPFKWYPPSELVHQMGGWRSVDLSESNGEPIDLVVALKFPAYLVRHPNKVVWLIHQHRTAYELWDHPVFADLSREPDGAHVRAMIHRADRAALAEARRLFTNSDNVRGRL